MVMAIHIIVMEQFQIVMERICEVFQSLCWQIYNVVMRFVQNGDKLRDILIVSL